MTGTPALSWRDGVSYGALGLPLAFLSLPLYVNLPSRYAEQHAVPLATLGAVLLATRALDAALDPFIGQAVDHVFARSANAAWRIVVVAAAVVCIGFIALFFPPLAGTALLVWLAAMLVLSYVAFSVLSVTHQAWGARLGGDVAMRTRVVSWREGAGAVGVLLASAVPALFGMAASTLVLVGAMALGVALLARAPRGSIARITSSASNDSVTSIAPVAPEARSDWRTPWADARFRGLLAVFMCNGIASAVPATLVLFFVRDRLQAADWEPLFLIAYFAAAIAAVPLWLRVVQKVGLTRAWLQGMALAVAAFVWAYTLGPGDELGFLAVCLASGAALGADLCIPGALLNGVIQRAHQPQDAAPSHSAAGVYTGWWTSATKLNLGIAAGAALPLLAWAGYAPGQRDAQALRALALAYVAVPCLLKLAAAGLLWRWRQHTQGVE